MPGNHPYPGTLGLLSIAGRIILTILFRLYSTPFRWLNWTGAPTISQDVAYAAIRTMLANLTIAQARYFTPSTEEVYLQLCRVKEEQPKYMDVESAKGVWIGEHGEDADYVLYYLHGGGFTQSCPLGHMQYLHRLVTDINASAPNKQTFSILLLTYTLVPEAHYPRQLIQAATLLSALLSTGRSPSRIILGGDSAGGNLMLSLISHILHPRSGVPEVKLSSPLAGAFLISPWVSFATDWPSYTRNRNKDTLEKSMLEKWGKMYLGASEDIASSASASNEFSPDAYNEPLSNGAEWWNGMPKVVQTVFMSMGGDEIFLDSLKEFAKVLTQGWEGGNGDSDKLDICEAQGEPHIGCIMDVLMQQEEKRSESELRLQAWVSGCMGEPQSK